MSGRSAGLLSTSSFEMSHQLFNSIKWAGHSPFFDILQTCLQPLWESLAFLLPPGDCPGNRLDERANLAHYLEHFLEQFICCSDSCHVATIAQRILLPRGVQVLTARPLLIMMHG